MTSLKEFLASQGTQVIEDRDADEIKGEWQASLARLMGQVRGWLREADPEGKYLSVEEEPHRLNEERIGVYDAPGLSIFLGARRVSLVPIARFVAGPLLQTGKLAVMQAHGRVDLTDGFDRFHIYRERVDPDDVWVSVKREGYEKQSFDQAAFESHMKVLLG